MNKEKVILFDGTNLDGWTTRGSGAYPNWKVEDGIVTVGNSDIISKYEFGDAHIHVEFRTPRYARLPRSGKGQQRRLYPRLL